MFTSRKRLLCMVVGAAGAMVVPGMARAQSSGSNSTVEMFQGVFRDFRGGITKGANPDFESSPASGRGVYVGIVDDQLDSNGSPVFKSTGVKVSSMSKDAKGRNVIGPKSYIKPAGDSAMVSNPAQIGGVKSSASFGDWYNERPNAAQSQLVFIGFKRSGDKLTFDAVPRKEFEKTIGTGANKNWGYTFELGADFIYDASKNDVITVGADDCLWVFINGKLVIDLGGSHDYAEQVVELNRVMGLEDGKKYSLKLFYAEREKSQSRLKIDTTIRLNPILPPPVSGKYD